MFTKRFNKKKNIAIAILTIFLVAKLFQHVQQSQEQIEYQYSDSPPHYEPTTTLSGVTLCILSKLSDLNHLVFLLSSIDNQKLLYSKLILLVPDDEVSAFQFLKPSATVIPESQLLVSNNNYAKQMFLKLLVAEYVETEFYLTLDSDCFLQRSYDWSEYIVDGRATLEAEDRSVHDYWWEASKKVLQIDGCDPPGSPLIGVTPSILSRRISLAVKHRLQELFGAQQYKEKLMEMYHKHQWTEYTIYRIVSCYYGLFDYLHFFGRPLSVGIWTEEEFKSWNSSRVGSPELPPWLIVQSQLGKSAHEIARTLFSV